MVSAHPTYRFFLWLLLLILALVFVAGIALFITPTPSLESPGDQVRLPPPVPPLTAERTVKAIGTKQFSLLVSYTDQGLEPKAASVKKGDTVRFVNNSTGAMNLSLPGAPQNLPPGEYWEETFDKTGDIAFHDASHPEAQASIRVQ